MASLTIMFRANLSQNFSFLKTHQSVDTQKIFVMDSKGFMAILKSVGCFYLSELYTSQHLRYGMFK